MIGNSGLRCLSVVAMTVLLAFGCTSNDTGMLEGD